MTSKDRGGGGFVAGFLLGCLVGAAAALVLTPRSGEETRDTLAETGIELRVRGEEVVAKARDEADDLISRGRRVLEAQKAKVQEAMEIGREAAAQKRNEMLAKYQAAKREGAVPPAEPPSPEVPPEM